MQPPKTADELLTRAHHIAGLSLNALAVKHEQVLPKNLLREKGAVGQLLEVALGANSGNKPQPDFQHLGIELKTIPIDHRGKPTESTFVCTVQFAELLGMQWRQSFVYKKLRHVLWVPIEADPSISLADRRIGTALLWQPSLDEEMILKNDWQELTDLICLGKLASITARLGTYLQIRPKAANARALCQGIGEEGDPIQTLPRGFYLRPKFTQQILQTNFIRGQTKQKN